MPAQGGIRAVVPERRGSPRFELRNAQVNIITNDNCKKENISGNPYDSPLPGPLWLAEHPVCFGGRWQGREREGEKEAPGPIPELTVTPPGDCSGPVRGVGVQGRGDGHHSLRAPESLAGRRAPGRSHQHRRGHRQSGLCSRENSSLISLALPSNLRPSSSPDFFRGERAPAQWPPFGLPRGSRAAMAPT